MMNEPRLRALLGLHGWKSTRGLDLMAICKQRIIEARRAGDDDLAAKLSEVKQMLKKRRPGHCVDCGTIISGGLRCKQHWRMHRFYNRALSA